MTERMKPLTVQGRPLEQVGLPYHWGRNGYSRGDAANELTSVNLDPNVHIQEVKAFAGDIQPGRRPRGAGRAARRLPGRKPLDPLQLVSTVRDLLRSSALLAGRSSR